MTQGSKED